jgi:hypothetical protein
MVHGIDLDQKFWISTPVETFRHLLYSCPRIQGGNSEPFSEDQALLKDFNKVREKIFIKELQDPQNKDKLFYMHIKPESFGMRGVTSTIGHAFSYVQTRIDKGYKKRKSYYGEKSGFSKDSSGKLKESGNGSFVMTIPQKGK